jgi:thiamine pyrophosphate-dependent acetolactate synthase large subunit-like protein
VDNELYGETGDQATHTASGVDLKTVAEGCGLTNTRVVTTKDQIADASKLLRQSNGPCFVVLKVAGGLPGDYVRNWHTEESKLAFRKALLGHR